MDLQTMQARCRERFRDPDQIVVDNDTWAEHLNAAYREFTRAAQWKFLLTVTILSYATDELVQPLAAGSRDIQDVYDTTNGSFLQPVPGDLDFRTRRFLERRSKKPLWWDLVGDDLYILPAAPAATSITVHHLQEPTALSAPIDVPVIPDTYHEALVVGALERAWHDDHASQLAQQYRTEYEGLIRSAMRDYALDPPNELPTDSSQQAAPARDEHGRFVSQ